MTRFFPTANRAKIGIAVALLATLCYSLKPILIKLIYQHDVASADVLAWRVIISLPLYLGVGVWAWLRHRNQVRLGQRKKQGRMWMVYTAILGALGFYVAALLDLLGLQYISSQLARLILFTYPTLVALFAWMLFGNRVSTRVVVALILSYLGVGMIFAYDLKHFGDQVLLGSLLMFGSVVSFSLYVLLSKRFIDQVGGTAFTVVAMLASGMCILLRFLVTEQSFVGLSLSPSAFGLIALMAIVTTVIPSFLMAEAIGLIGPQKTAIAGTIGPALTSVFAVLLLAESFGWAQGAGLLLVVAAIAYMQGSSPARAG